MRRYRNSIIAALFIPAALLLAAALTGCAKDETTEPGGGTTAAPGSPHFEVRIADGWNNGWSAATPGGGTKAPLDGTAFPAGATYQIGMRIAYADGTPYATGTDHILAELTVNTTAPTHTWRYQLKGSSEWVNQLPQIVEGQMPKICAYYPYNASTAVSTDGMNVPFDLTTAAQQADQTDLLYVPQTDVEADGPTPLLFRHFYAQLEFRLKNARELSAVLQSVNVRNAGSLSWVINKGACNAVTGELKGSPVSGPVTVGGLNLALNTTSYQSVQVMVPPNTPMTSFADNDVLLDFAFADGQTVPVVLKRDWLFANGNKGLMAGKKYSIPLLYDAVFDAGPDASVSLTFIGWESDEQEGNPGKSPYVIEFGAGEHPKTDAGSMLLNGSISDFTLPFAVSTSYNGLSINKYYNTDILTHYVGGGKEDLPFRILEVENSYSSSYVMWREAWTYCDEKLPLKTWRLPRASELLWIWMNYSTMNAVEGILPLDQDTYWSGTELNSLEAYYMYIPRNEFKKRRKDVAARARCVRELPVVYPPTTIKMGEAPFYETSLTSIWMQTFTITAQPTNLSWHGATTGKWNDLATLLKEERPYKSFEVALEDEGYSFGKMTWDQANWICAQKAPAGKWRLPRATEMMLIFANRTALEQYGCQKFPTTGTNLVHWSATETASSTTAAWGLDCSNKLLGTYDKSTQLYVRCVREY